MKKVLVIRNTLKVKLKEKIASKIFEYESKNFFGGETALQIIEEENPDLVFCEVIEPVDGNDYLVAMLGRIDDDVRLRVSIYKNVSASVVLKKLFMLNYFSRLFSSLSYQKNEESGQAILRSK